MLRRGLSRVELLRREFTLVRHENGQSHACQQIMRDAAKHLFPQARMTKGASDNQVGAHRVCLYLQAVCDRVVTDVLNSQ